MTIQLITVGKLKEAYYRSAAEEYRLRLSRYCKLAIVEVPDEKDPGEQSLALIEKAKELEGQRILGKITNQDVVVALCIEGEQMGSDQLAQQIKSWQDRSASVSFIIGGSLGLSGKVLERANLKLSFSKMTFPHQLARVMLLEQLYRAYKINAGERYHK